MKGRVGQGWDCWRTEPTQQPAALTVSPLLRAAGTPRDGELEIFLDDNRISQHLREMLERPENYLRPIRIRESWRLRNVEEDGVTEARSLALATSKERHRG